MSRAENKQQCRKRIQTKRLCICAQFDGAGGETRSSGTGQIVQLLPPRFVHQLQRLDDVIILISLLVFCIDVSSGKTAETFRRWLIDVSGLLLIIGTEEAIPERSTKSF